MDNWRLKHSLYIVYELELLRLMGLICAPIKSSIQNINRRFVSHFLQCIAFLRHSVSSSDKCLLSHIYYTYKMTVIHFMRWDRMGTERDSKKTVKR